MATGKTRTEVPGTNIRTYPPCDPGRAWKGKFVQVELDGISWLLFAGPEAFRYHNQVLAAFLEETGVACRWRAPEILDYDRQRVRVAGGGRFHIHGDSATLVLWDKSSTYGRFDEARIMKDLAAADAPWSGLRVRIRDDPQG